MKTSTHVFYWPARNVWVAWIRDTNRFIHHTYHPTPDHALLHAWDHIEETA